MWICERSYAHTGGVATCTTLAECEVCKMSYGEYNIDNHPAEKVFIEAKDPTCKELGNIAYYSCACGYAVDENGNELTYEEIYISSLGHKYGDDHICDVCESVKVFKVLIDDEELWFETANDVLDYFDDNQISMAEIIVCDDVNFDMLIELQGNFVLDLNGHLLNAVIRAYNGSLTIRDSSEEKTGVMKAEYVIFINDGTLIIENGTFAGSLEATNSTVMVYDGTFTGVYGFDLYDNAMLSIYGGKFICEYEEVFFASDSSAKAVIYEAVFPEGIYVSGASITDVVSSECTTIVDEEGNPVEIEDNQYEILSYVAFKTVHDKTNFVDGNDAFAHYKECPLCGFQIDRENHYGGMATCTELAVCDACDTSYGHYKEHTFAEEGKCEVCEKQMPLKFEYLDEVKYFSSIDELALFTQNNQVIMSAKITLLTDCVENTNSIQYLLVYDLVVDVNGFTWEVYGLLGSLLEIIDSSADKTGKVISNSENALGIYVTTSSKFNDVMIDIPVYVDGNLVVDRTTFLNEKNTFFLGENGKITIHNASFPNGLTVVNGLVTDLISVDCVDVFDAENTQVELNENTSVIDFAVIFKESHDLESLSMTIDGNYHKKSCNLCAYSVDREPHSFNEDGTCEVCLVEATVKVIADDQEFLAVDLDSAQEYLETYDNLKVVLLDDNYVMSINTNLGNLTIDLNGFSISGVLFVSCDMTIIDSSEDKSGTIGQVDQAVFAVTGSLTINSGNILGIIEYVGSVTINGGIFSSNSITDFGNGSLIINGGTFTAGLTLNGSKYDLFDVLPNTCYAYVDEEGNRITLANSNSITTYFEVVHLPVEVVDAAKAPTCTEAGLTEGKHCSECKEILVAQEEVVALGHTFGNEWKKDDKTHWKECACGEKKDVIAHTDSDKDGSCDSCEFAMEVDEKEGGCNSGCKGGCGGSIISSFIGLFTLGATAYLLARRRRED